ncbi:hypothetical protein IWW48_002627 [Coemansia sp. RSA 1200]|nr:hypothetical protein IWW48_002627 [Coemansia sp. RSA 1200]
MFQSVRYHQSQAAQPVASSSHQEYLERQPKTHIPPPLVLPPLVHRSERAVGFGYHFSAQQNPASPRSPPNTCYSPGTSMASDATVFDYPLAAIHKDSAPHSKSPPLSYASSNTSSPAPLSTLAATAAISSSPSTSISSSRDSCSVPKKRRIQEQPDQSAKRKRGGRGTRSVYTAEEKEMRRKISHSAIEKRRRERTNNVLRDLQDMVPWLGKSSKVQKLEILEAAAQYIKELRLQSDPVSGGDKNTCGSPTLSALTHVNDDSDTDPVNEDVDNEQIHHNQRKGRQQQRHTRPFESQGAMKVNFLLS